MRVQFTPQREGNTKRGEAITRGMVSTGIEWLPLSAEAATTDDTDEGTDDTQQPGGGGEDPLG